MNDILVRISNHATGRIEERFDLEEADAKNLAERAWNRGKTSEDYSGKAKKYIMDIQMKYNNDGFIVKTYGNMFFIFSNTGVLCTAYKESKTFKKLKNMLPVYREHELQYIVDESASFSMPAVA